jgi:hypothetical protein
MDSIFCYCILLVKNYTTQITNTFYICFRNSFAHIFIPSLVLPEPMTTILDKAVGDPGEIVNPERLSFCSQALNPKP